ncbi:restriction endonuclease subunit S [Thermococci archaeon]|nr:MAG: restriction endonuclease subunit S [Thermococci archaeon]
MFQQKKKEFKNNEISFYWETEFKNTEIGRIPKEWKVMKIKDIGKVITGKTPPTGDREYWNGEIPFITPADMGDSPYVYTTNRYVTMEGAEKVGKLLPENTVLVVCIGSTIGKVALTYKESVTNQQINAIICNRETNPNYLYYTLLFNSWRLKSFSGIAAVPIIKKSLFEIFKIPLPPLSEQKKIAEVLSTVDEAIRLVDESIARTERLKKGLMQELLTKGIGHKEFKQTEMGKMPKEWKVVTLESISLRIKTGPFGSQLKKDELSNSGFKVYTQENILKNDFEIGDLYITPEKFRKLRNMEVKPGDVLLTIRGTIGYSAVVPANAKRGIIHSNLAYIRVKKDIIIPEFLSQLINGYQILRYQIQAFSSSTTLGALYAKVIKRLKIPLPPIREQQKIIEIFSTIDKTLEIKRKRREKLERIKKALMDLLLTGKVRVKV